MLRYRILNVFTRGADRLSGNPLCVFEDGSALDDATMQALALQLNLSETTFLLPPTRPEARARVRIFTPTFEMPFAGHPTLGTAEVVRALRGGDALVLEMQAGLVPVTATGSTWTLRTARAPETRPVEATRAELAAMLSVPVDVTREAGWVDTGAEQLVFRLANEDAVNAVRPDPLLLARHGWSEKRREAMVYTWAHVSPSEVVARFFFVQHGAVIEDPATGSACANLGGWHAARGQRDVTLHVRQGERIGRPSDLRLRVDAEGAIFVGGDVIELGEGVIRL